MKYFIMGLVAFSIQFTTFSKQRFEKGLFSGRVSMINEEIGLLRVKVDFSNVKYLNKKDKVEFWSHNRSGGSCEAYIIGRTSDYLLLKIPDVEICKKVTTLTTGLYLNFFSQDFINNISMGKEVTEILLKKRMALTGKMRRKQRDIDSHIEKVNAVNVRYEVLRKKLLADWRQQIQDLEEDNVNSLKVYKELEMRLDEVNHKLQKYRVENENLKEDRWSLDSRLYYSK